MVEDVLDAQEIVRHLDGCDTARADDGTWSECNMYSTLHCLYLLKPFIMKLGEEEEEEEKHVFVVEGDGDGVIWDSGVMMQARKLPDRPCHHASRGTLKSLKIIGTLVTLDAVILGI